MHTICDFICKNVYFGGTNRIILDQLFTHMIVFMVKSVHGETKLIVVDVLGRQIS